MSVLHCLHFLLIQKSDAGDVQSMRGVCMRIKRGMHACMVFPCTACLMVFERSDFNASMEGIACTWLRRHGGVYDCGRLRLLFRRVGSAVTSVHSFEGTLAAVHEKDAFAYVWGL